MANADYSKSSPYYGAQVFDSKFLDIINIRSVPRLPDDVLTAIGQTYNHRPDLMAYDLYGNSGFWWVFAARNPNTLFDPIWSFTAGTEIYLPQKRALLTALGV
jgi:hypothetical protein